MDTMAFHCLRELGDGIGMAWHGMTRHGYASNCVKEASKEAGFSSSLEYG